jgi:hypothetical protein
MQRKGIRMLLLAVVSTIALWPVATSWALDFCPVQSCPFWSNVCTIGGGTWSLTDTGICLMENNSVNEKFRGTCTAPTHDSWTMDCIDM